MFNKMRVLLGLLNDDISFVHERPYGGVDRDQVVKFRTPQEKKAHSKARAKAKNAKKARKINRR